MPIDTLFALVSFAFVMSISPGPGNFLLLSSGVNFGFFRSLPLILGICIGFLTMVFFVGIGLGQLLNSYPVALTILKLVCGTYVLWLAWKIGKSRSMSGNNDGPVDKPISFLQAALFQLVNPKAWAVAFIVTVSYTNPDHYIPSLLLMILVFATVNIPAISVWAASGMALRRIIGNEKRIAIFNISMAVLLVGSMIPVLIT